MFSLEKEMTMMTFSPPPPPPLFLFVSLEKKATMAEIDKYHRFNRHRLLNKEATLMKLDAFNARLFCRARFDE